MLSRSKFPHCIDKLYQLCILYAIFISPQSYILQLFVCVKTKESHVINSLLGPSYLSEYFEQSTFESKPMQKEKTKHFSHFQIDLTNCSCCFVVTLLIFKCTSKWHIFSLSRQIFNQMISMTLKFLYQHILNFFYLSELKFILGFPTR